MSTKKGAGLAKGTRLADYASPSRIKTAFDNNEKAIRAEYSRQRSIVRKRIERLEKAGEVYNEFYERFGNLDQSLPSLKNLTTEQAMRLMSSSASALAGGYQTSLSEIRSAREDVLESLAAQAEEEEDYETAEMLRTDMSPAKFDRMRRLMGILNHAGVTRFKPSGDTWKAAAQAILSNDSHTSLLKLAGEVMDKLGIEFEDQVKFMQSAKETYTAKGRYRVSYQKARQKRGT